MTLSVTVLGCGSSTGVPRVGAGWGACDPANPKNRRSRCSMLARRHGAGGETTVLIDTSPDLREQMLAARVTEIDGLLYTHDHADQTHGVDDLRVFVIRNRRRIPAWMDEETWVSLQPRFPYIFESQLGYPALLDRQRLPPHGARWAVQGKGGDVPVVTFDQAHGPIRSVGYRLGPVAYSSDVSDLDDAAFAALEGVQLWIVDALRLTPHPTHAHLDQALEWIARSGAPRAVLTNLHIDMDHARLSAMLPDHIEPAYDGWTTRLAL